MCCILAPDLGRRQATHSEKTAKCGAPVTRNNQLMTAGDISDQCTWRPNKTVPSSADIGRRSCPVCTGCAQERRASGALYAAKVKVAAAYGVIYDRMTREQDSRNTEARKLLNTI